MQWPNDAVEVRGSFQETAHRKTVENTVKHSDAGVGLVVANHSGGGESSVVVTTLVIIIIIILSQLCICIVYCMLTSHCTVCLQTVQWIVNTQ